MTSSKMISDIYIRDLSRHLKALIAVFLLVLSIGFFSGLAFVQNTTGGSNAGIIENYNGNEENEEAEQMKFKKSDHEMLNIIHTHILSMSIIFFIIGLLVYATKINAKLKYLLMIEPLLSVLITFGSIYLVWMDLQWMSYVTMVSGGLMTLSFVWSVILVYREVFSKR